MVRRGEGDFLFVLVPGDREISWPKLRTLLGVSRLSMPDKDVAREVTGYERGTITPFGSTTAWPVIADALLVQREGPVSIGAGAHGLAATVAPEQLIEVLEAQIADVTEPLTPRARSGSSRLLQAELVALGVLHLVVVLAPRTPLLVHEPHHGCAKRDEAIALGVELLMAWARGRAWPGCRGECGCDAPWGASRDGRRGAGSRPTDPPRARGCARSSSVRPLSRSFSRKSPSNVARARRRRRPPRTC